MERQPLTQFTIDAHDGPARAGTLRLPRGTVQTPVFMPVGTQAAVKALDPADLRDVGSQIILANTYHLMLRPGSELIEQHGGASHFMRWDGPLLTDSGGFQVFSLAANRTISNDGVAFRSHLDGSLHHLTPESSIQIQGALGADITMAFDVCVGFGATLDEQHRAMDLTHQWLPRCVDAFDAGGSGLGAPRRLLFGICQGGFDAANRRRSAAFLAQAACDGVAIGGLSVGEPKDVMAEMLAASASELPSERPRYLMGVGSPEDLWNAVAAGIDMFDCVLPTRVARRGAVYTAAGRINIAAARFLSSDEPIEAECDCYACRTFPSGYLCHLFRAQELLAYRLASIHNLRFIHRQMETMRASIHAGEFEKAHQRFQATYAPADQRVAAEQRAKFRARHARH